MAMLLGIGNPLLDISADVGQDFLDKYEVKLNNAILCEDKHKPMYDELVDKFKVTYIAGGATQNSIRVAQWMLQKPESTGIIGCVGKDKFGKQLTDCATADGVKVLYLEDEKEATGTCAVCINSKERSLIANLSAANCYKKEHFDSEAIQNVVERASFVYSAGFFLTVSPPTVQAIGQHCADKNKVFAMNLSAPFITQFFADPLMAAIPFCDFVFGNESEAEAFGETQKYEDKSVKGVALKIAAMPKTNTKLGRKRYCVITQGCNPTVVACDGVVTEYPVDKIEDKDIVDVNGAGDAFVGGFMAALMSGKDIADCAKAGHYASSVILKVSGCVLTGKPSLTV